MPDTNNMRDYLEQRERTLEARVAALEDDLSVMRLQLARIADEVIDPDLDEIKLRRVVANIRYIINPAK